MSLKPTMSLEEAAQTLKIHPHTLEKIIRAGGINAGKIGRAYVLMTRDVLAYAEKIIMRDTADRLRAKPSPHRHRKVAGAQVRVAHQHPVALVAADFHDLRLG